MSHSVCVSDHLTISDEGLLQMAPWSVPQLVADDIGWSRGDGALWGMTTLPGRLLIDISTGWRNRTPVDHMVLIRVTRGAKSWVTSNPNAVQFRDRWSWAIDAEAAEPVTSGLYNGQVGSAGDLGTNTVAEPMPGVLWHWWGATTADEMVGPVRPGQELDIKYRAYVWTPPPWSGNANKNSPNHAAGAGYTRIQLIAFPDQSELL